MSNQTADDNQRRRAEQEEGAAKPRAYRLGVVGPAFLILLALAGVSYAATRAGDSTSSPAAATVRSAPTPFEQHYAGLVQRRQAAHVPTMMGTMDSRVHFHPLLKVYVNGKQMAVPANIGIDPREDPMQMAGLHTHDTTGTIHNEGVPGAKLAQFFAIWGVPFSAGQLGPYRTGAHRSVRMWVDGKPSQAFGALRLVDSTHRPQLRVERRSASQRLSARVSGHPMRAESASSQHELRHRRAQRRWRRPVSLPSTRGVTGNSTTDGRKSNFRCRSIRNPAAWMARAVSRLGWQPPPTKRHTGVTRSCKWAGPDAEARTCS